MVKLDPDLAPLVEALSTPGLPSIRTSTPADLRAMLASLSPPGGRQVERVEDTIVKGVPTREYWPTADPLASICYFHGGGWVLGSVADYDSFARNLAIETGCRVVSVDYRLAPEHRFPAAVDDAWAVATGITPHGPLIVGGDSAGGNLAAVVAQKARDEGSPVISAQILIYPSIQGDITSKAMFQFIPPVMPREDIAAFFDLYIPDLSSRTDPSFAPGKGNLGGLPPALVVTAGLDLLAAEAKDYAAALLDQGSVAVQHHEPGAVHAYLTLAPDSQASVRTVERITAFVRSTLNRGAN